MLLPVNDDVRPAPNKRIYQGMALYRLTDDAILTRPFASSLELASRVTGGSMPLDEEQGVVVTLLSRGPLDLDELQGQARHQGVNWDRETLERFIDDLERWGLLEVEDPTASETFDEEDRTPSDAFAGGPPPDVYESAPPPDVYESAPPPDVYESAPPPGARESRPPAGAHRSGLLSPLPAVAPPDDELRDEATQISTAPLMMAHLSEAEDRPTESGEAAKTLNMSPGRAAGQAPARPEARTMDLSPGRAAGQAPAQPEAQTIDVPPARTTRPPDPGARSPRPQLRLVPPEGGEDEPTGVAIRQSHELPVPPLGSGRADAGSGPFPYPRLLPKWMPKLMPQTRNILLVDPTTNTQRELQSWEYQVARMMQGQRSPEQVAAWAQTAGLQLQLETVLTIIERMIDEGILEPGTEPLEPASLPASDATRPELAADRVAPLLDVPSEEFGGTPDSIMESLSVMPVGQRGPEQAGEAEPQSTPSARYDLDSALARAAALIQEGDHARAEQALRAIVEHSPAAVQALAMLDLIGARTGKRPSSRLGLWLGLGAFGLVLVTALILSLVIKVDATMTLPCSTALIPAGEVKAGLGGKVTAVAVVKGAVVEKGAKLASVEDEETRRQVAELKHQIKDQKELLRIMKTTGTVADERRQKRLVAQLTTALEEQSCDGDAACEQKVKRIKSRIESAKLKLKFCEWQAEPDEITQVEQHVAKLEQTLTPLAGRPVAASVVSPAPGLVTAVKVTQGKRVASGETVVVLADTSRFRVVAKHAGALPEDVGQATVRLTGAAGTQIYVASPQKAQREGELAFVVAAAARGLSDAGACMVDITRGKKSLLLSWFD